MSKKKEMYIDENGITVLPDGSGFFVMEIPTRRELEEKNDGCHNCLDRCQEPNGGFRCERWKS